MFHTNDPDIAAIAFAESDFFTKQINPAHPLHGIKNVSAGIFLGDTDTPEWRVAHKFLPPALGPKAVRHCMLEDSGAYKCMLTARRCPIHAKDRRADVQSLR